MRYFLTLLLAASLSILLYVLMFALLVDRPLVVDQIGPMAEKKVAYAAAASGPKIFILAGSNARFSHSCAVLEEILHRPCVNLGISAGIGLDWIIDKAKPFMDRGDVVYMPIEYPLYSQPRAQLYMGMDAAYSYRHDKRALLHRGAEGVLRAGFSFSLPLLIQSAGEMVLNAMGVRRRYGVDTLDAQGDEIGHTSEKARAYATIVRNWPRAQYPAATLLSNPDGTQRVLVNFLDWARAHGVIAVGGLPTTFDDVQISDAAVDELRTFYLQHGAGFIALPNRSQYPRADFYDTDAHLQEPFQHAHSRKVAAALKPYVTP